MIAHGDDAAIFLGLLLCAWGSFLANHTLRIEAIETAGPIAVALSVFKDAFWSAVANLDLIFQTLPLEYFDLMHRILFLCITVIQLPTAFLVKVFLLVKKSGLTTFMGLRGPYRRRLPRSVFSQVVLDGG